MTENVLIVEVKITKMRPNLLPLIACLLTVFGIGSGISHWENLECEVRSKQANILDIYEFNIASFYLQAGHKYLFSDEKRPWQDAMLECELYGGFLLSLKDISEQNCLMRYAQSQNLNHWYWTDGKLKMNFFRNNCKCNDIFSSFW